MIPSRFIFNPHTFDAAEARRVAWPRYFVVSTRTSPLKVLTRTST